MSKKKYWEQFYKKYPSHTLMATDFAHFCLPFMPENAKIIEFGSGNGRDTYFFASLGFKAIGIDYAYAPKAKINCAFYKYNLLNCLRSNPNNKFDVIYSRFFIHSITNKEIDALLKWAKKWFFAEFRAKNDKPILYPKHYRNKVDENRLLAKMIKYGFKIIYYSVSKNMANFKQENPTVVRIIAKKQK